MKNTLLLTFCLAASLLLAGCVTPPSGTNTNPPALAPNVAAVYANQTAQAAQDQADSFNAQASATSQDLTSTAYAPIAEATQAAINLQIQKMYGDATSTSAAATQTANAVQQAYYAQATTTSGVATQVAAVTQQAFLVQQDIDAKDAQRREIENTFWAYARPLLFVFFLGLALVFAVHYLRSQRKKPIERDENGKTKPIIDIVTGKYVDLNASPNYFDEDMSLLKQMFVQYLQNKYGFVPAMPQITAERQDRTKEREQIIEIERIRRARLPKALIDSQGMRFLPEPVEEGETDIDHETYPELPFPSWVELNKWDGRLLPVGNDESSKLMLVDTSLRPHLLYAGRSRSGKTLTGERTAVACLLTQGWNVIVMGKRVDWMPFTDHPNFKLLAVDVRKDAQKYIDILQILTAQMDIRDSLLTSKGIGTWGRYGAPSTMVVLDDYSGALIRMPAPKSKEVISEVRSIALDGAKFGLSITIGLQDATAQNIDTTTRSQMARIVFSMDNATKSRIALGSNSGEGPGAECLPPRGHFLARVSDDSNIRRGVGFFLQDREVEAFLASRPVQQNGEMEWIDGVIINQPELPGKESAKLSAPAPAAKMSVEEFVNNLSEWEVKALDFYEAGMDQIAIVQSIFADDNPEIGKVAVADLIKRWLIVKGVQPADSPREIQNEIKEPRKKTEQETIVELAEQIRSRWSPALNKTETSTLLGKTYEGTSWVRKVNLVYAYLKSTTTSPESPQSAPSGDFQPSFQ